MTECGRLSEQLGIRVLLKREDLAHTGSHKLNNVVGQGLLARRMGKRGSSPRPAQVSTGWPRPRRRHCSAWSASSTWARSTPSARSSTCSVWSCWAPPCDPVTSGSRTLKDAVNEALREWVATVEDTHYCLGSVMGPHPYPWMVRELQRVIGDEARQQCRELLGGADPDVVVACAGGGSNAAGIFAGFADATSARPGGRGGRRRGGRDNGHPRGAPRHAQRSDPGRGGADPRGGVDLGRAGLPGHRARARPPRRDSVGPDTVGRGRRGPRGIPAPGPHRGNPPGPRVGPRPGLGGRRPRAGGDAAGLDRAGQPSGRGDKDVAQVREILRGRS